MKCSLCGKENLKQINAKIRNAHSEDMKVYECYSCGVQFLHPYFSEEQLKEYYAKEYRKEYENEDFYSDEYITNFFNSMLPESVDRVNRNKEFLKSSDNILEIGCSAGYFLESVKPFVKAAFGSEWDENNSNYAKKKGFEIKKNPEDFGMEFDKIFMFHVLEHIKDAVDYLSRLKDVLSDDGTLFIEVPNNTDILLTDYDIQEFRDFYYQSAHLWNFNEKSLGYVLEKAGYEADILHIQRYDLSNHIVWLKDKKPGGLGRFNNIFTETLKEEYVRMLEKNKNTDTIYAICKIKKQ